MMAIYDWCSGVCQEDIVKGITPCHTQTGEEISLTTIHHDDYLCKEFIISYKPFSLRRWLIWMVIFNILGYLLELHTQVVCLQLVHCFDFDYIFTKLTTDIHVLYCTPKKITQKLWCLGSM